MVEVKTFNKFGLWFPIVGIILSSLILFGIFMAGYTFLKWSLTLELISILTIAWYTSWGLIAWLGWKISKTKIKEVFSLKHVKPKNLFQVVILAVTAQVILIASTYFVSQLIGQEIKGNASELIQDGMTPLMLALTISITVFFAPVFEEILFRGLLFDGFLNTSRKLKANNKLSIIIATTLSSLLFGLAHVSSFDINALVIFLATGLFGLYLAYLRLKTGSLTLSILAHMVFNSVTVILLLIAQQATA